MPEKAMTFQTAKPKLALQRVVDLYSLRDADLRTQSRYIPLPARSNCFLTFYLEDPYTLFDLEAKRVFQAPSRLALVGPHERRREDIIYQGRLKVFTIQFSPIGFHALFGIPTRLIRNRGHQAEAVLGSSVVELGDWLADAKSFADCVAVAERFLEGKLAQRVVSPGALKVLQMTHILRQSHGAVDIAELAASYDLSVRQVERSFQDYVGVSPKVYSRLARFHQALKLSASSSSLDGTNWAEVASRVGYFDQSHMTREFRDLAGDTPAHFVALSQPARARAASSLIDTDASLVRVPTARTW